MDVKVIEAPPSEASPLVNQAMVTCSVDPRGCERLPQTAAISGAHQATPAKHLDHADVYGVTPFNEWLNNLRR